MEFIRRIGSGVKNFFTAIFKFISEGFKELKKVRWPSRKELVSYSTIVIVTVTFVAVFFFVVDLGISSLLQVFGFGK